MKTSQLVWVLIPILLILYFSAGFIAQTVTPIFFSPSMGTEIPVTLLKDKPVLLPPLKPLNYSYKPVDVSVKLLNFTALVDGYGKSARVIGELQNTGNVPLDYIGIKAVFYGKNGIVLDKVTSTPEILPLAPGQKSPFNLFTVKEDVSYVKICIVEYRPGLMKNYNLKIENFFIKKDKYGNPYIQGTVLNEGNSEIKFSKVVAVGYSPTGKIVAVESSFTTPTILYPNTTGHFEITMFSYFRVDYPSKIVLDVTVG